MKLRLTTHERSKWMSISAFLAAFFICGGALRLADSNPKGWGPIAMGLALAFVTLRLRK